jgi:hypothetical protein
MNSQLSHLASQARLDDMLRHAADSRRLRAEEAARSISHTRYVGDKSADRVSGRGGPLVRPLDQGCA